VFTIAGSTGAATEGEGMMTYAFAVNYLHRCTQNTLTRADGSTVAYKYFVASNEQHKYHPSITSSVAGCELTASLSFDGTPYVADPKSHAFVVSFDETTGELHIDADSFEGQQGASVDLTAEMVFVDPFSTTGNSATVTDNFDVTLTNPCTAAVGAFDAAITDRALTIQNQPTDTVQFAASVTDSALEYC
jgi:hypothetical protein